MDIGVEEFGGAPGGDILDLAGVGLGEFKLVGVDKACLDEGSGLTSALAGMIWMDEAAVVPQVLGQITACTGEYLAEVFRRDFADVSTDLVADLEYLAEDIGQALAAVEAEQGTYDAVGAGFLGKDFDGDGDGARVGWVKIGDPAQSVGGGGEGADGVGGSPGSFPNVQEMVDGDAIEPGAELGFCAESWEGLDGFEEDLLGGVFGVGLTVEHTEGDVEEPGEMAGEEEFELGVITGVRGRDELFVGGVGRIVKEWVCSEIEGAVHEKPPIDQTIRKRACDRSWRICDFESWKDCRPTGRECSTWNILVRGGWGGEVEMFHVEHSTAIPSLGGSPKREGHAEREIWLLNLGSFPPNGHFAEQQKRLRRAGAKSFALMWLLVPRG